MHCGTRSAQVYGAIGRPVLETLSGRERGFAALGADLGESERERDEGERAAAGSWNGGEGKGGQNEMTFFFWLARADLV